MRSRLGRTSKGKVVGQPYRLLTFSCCGATEKAKEQKKKGAPRPSSEIVCCEADQRFENWNERRALARPYFLRSTTRLSRVRKPPRLSTERSSGSYCVSAFDRPWRTAPAWPESPPPDTEQTTSYWPVRVDATRGRR